MSELAPKMWSDFDGTAVEKYGWKNPRNWRKYPLPGIPGYVDFMTGVQDTGVELAGAVTIRKARFRRTVTNRSIAELGYAGVIPLDRVVYAGNEKAKGEFLARRAWRGPVGMIDDKPHKIGMAIFDALHTDKLKLLNRLPNPITLGVVAHDKTDEYIAELAEQIGQSRTGSGSPRVAELRVAGLPGVGLSVDSMDVRLRVLPVGPYSHEAGVVFGTLLADTKFHPGF